jgi:nitrite reductase/ring-hydroxylating ferredoxin subunit
VSVPEVEVEVGRFDELDDPGCREFRVGTGDWPFKGFVVRRGNEVFAYQNYCMHVGHPLNWQPNEFLNKDGNLIVCSSHGALYEIDTGVCIAGPCPGKALNNIPVEIRNGSIVVRAPAAER